MREANTKMKFLENLFGTKCGVCGQKFMGKRFPGLETEQLCQTCYEKLEEKSKLLENSTYTQQKVYKHSDSLKSIALSPDGRYALSAVYKTATHWDLQNGRALHSIYFPDSINSVAISPDGQYGLVGSGLGEESAIDCSAHLLDLKMGRKAQRFAINKENPYDMDSPVESVDFSSDGKYAIAGSGGEGGLRVWDIQSGKLFRYFRRGVWVHCLDCSLDGNLIIAGYGHLSAKLESEKDFVARLWDLQKDEPICVYTHTTPVDKVAFSPKSDYVVTLSWKTIRVFNIKGHAVRTFDCEGDIRCITFAHTGQHVLYGKDNQINLLDVKSGKTKSLFRHDDLVTSVVVSPDGKNILSGSRDNTMRLWSISTS